MRRILAIALASARNGIRSRGMLAVVATLIFMLTGLILMMRDDGTAEGFIQLAVTYPSALLFAFLSVMAVWSGSAAMAEEIDRKTIQLVATKPIAMLQLWAGKWLGLMMLLSLLLVAGKIAGFLFIKTTLADWRTHEPQKHAEALDLLTARRAIPPVNTSTNPIVIRPSGAYEWRFRKNREEKMALEYCLYASSIGQHRAEGRWIIRVENGDELHTTSTTSPVGRWNRIVIPKAAGSGTGEWMVRYENHDPDGAPVYITPDGHPRLLEPAIGFTQNYIRSALLDLLRLSLITAIAVSAGSLFSLPVAALVSFFVMVLLQVAPLLPAIAGQTGHHHHHGESHNHATEEGPLTIASRALVTGIAHLTRPIHLPGGAGDLAHGRLIDAPRLTRALLHGVVLPAAIGIACSLALRRRELALPER